MALWQTFADAAARALALSILESSLLAALAAFALRARPGTRASTRHTVWLGVLLVAALLPLVSLASSLARIEHVRMHGETAGRSAGTAVAADAFARMRAHQPVRGIEGTGTTHRPGVARPSRPTSEAFEIPGTPVPVETAASGLVFALLIIGGGGAVTGFAGLLRGAIALAQIKRGARPFRMHTALLRDARRGTKRRFALAATDAVDVPVAIGFRTPAVLVPERVIAGSSDEDLARIVLHESAHLQRYDDVANLVQRTIERLFWFNPAIAFVGSQLTLERELAADEWVVARTGAAYDYASCLVRLLDLVRVPARGVAAPSALSSRRDLAIRIERLIDRGEGRPGRTRRGGVLIAGFLGVCALGLQSHLAPALAVADRDPDATATGLAPDAAPSPSPSQASDSLERHLERARLLSTALVRASSSPELRSFRIARAAPEPLAAAATAQDPATPLAAIPPPPPAPASPASLTAASRMPAGPLTIQTLAPELDREIHRAMRDLQRLRDLGAANERVPERPSRVARLEASRGAPGLTLAAGDRCSGCDEAGADLHGRDLHAVRLAGSDFAGANLRRANLSGANLQGVDLSRADLAGADLRGAVLDGVSLDGANLSGARLAGARVRGANLTGSVFDDADLRNVDFEGCTFERASFARAQTSGSRVDGKDAVPSDFSRRGA